MSAIEAGLKKSGITIRKRHRAVSRTTYGLEPAWTEYQVVSGRKIISRHCLYSEALKAALAHTGDQVDAPPPQS